MIKAYAIISNRPRHIEPGDTCIISKDPDTRAAWFVQKENGQTYGMSTFEVIITFGNVIDPLLIQAETDPNTGEVLAWTYSPDSK